MKHPRLLRLGLALASPLLLLALLEGGARWLVGDTAPPSAGFRDPYFRPLVSVLEEGVDDGPLRDEDGRPFLACDPSLALKIGKEPCDRRWFVAEKRPGSMRIFCLGGSSTYGLNYAPAVSFAGLLEARLRRLLPDRDLEVINAGISGYHARDVREVAHEAMDHEADVLVVYAGHNELKYPNLARVQSPGWHSLLGRSALLRSLVPDDVTPRMPGPIVERPFLRPEELLRAEDWYARELRELLLEARDRGVTVVLATPASNVRDKGPRLTVLTRMHSLFHVFVQDLRTWEQELGPPWVPEAQAEEAQAFGAGADDKGLDHFRRELEDFLKTQPDAALAHFLLGRVWWRQGKAAAAQAAFLRSQEADGLSERASPAMVQSVRDLAAEFQVPLADVVARMAELSPGGTPGFNLFYDYCHPNLEGTWWIADTILRALAEHGILAPTSAFAWEAEPAEEPLTAYLQEMSYDPIAQVRGRLERVQTLIGQAPVLAERREELLAIAEEWLVAVLRDHPGHAEATLLLGMVSAMQGRGELAVSLFRQAQEAHPGATQAFAARVEAAPLFVRELMQVGIRVGAGRFSFADDHP